MGRHARLALLIAVVIAGGAVPAPAEDLLPPGPHREVARGLSHRVRGEYAPAETAFRKALEQMAPDHHLAPAVRHHLGRTLVAQERFQEAIPQLRPLAEARPENGGAVYWLAVALFFSGRYEDCLPGFERAARLEPGLSNKALYYTGVALLKLGRTPKGHAALRHLAERAPESREARSAEPILAFLEDAAKGAVEKKDRTQAAGTVPPPPRKKTGPWSLYVAMGMEYDDNVSLIPDAATTLPEGISSEEAWRFTYSAGGSWEFLRRGGHRMEATLGYSGTDNRHLGSFDVDSLSVSVPWRFTSAPFQVRLAPRISHTWVSNERYARTWGATPGLSFQPVRWTWTDLDYSFNKSRYLRTPPNPEEDRDALSHWIGLRQSFSFPNLFLDGRTSFFAVGVDYSSDHADGSSYDNRALGGSFVFQQGLGWDITVLARISYRELRYENPHVRSPEEEERSDDDVTGSLQVFKKLREDLTLYTGYRRYENDSNLSRFYEYDSDVFFFGLRFDL